MNRKTETGAVRRRIPPVLVNATVVIVSAGFSTAVILAVLNRSGAMAGNSRSSAASATADSRLPRMRESDLAPYDGQDSDKPIYIGLDGYVYDVTAGASFYRPGGSYHFLAGRDSSTELHIAGGAIIKRKYPVVATLIP